MLRCRSLALRTRSQLLFATGLILIAALEAPALGQERTGSSNSSAGPATSIGSEPHYAATWAPAAASIASIDAAAHSDDPVAESTGDKGWEVMVVPYLWASGMKADISTPQGEGVDIDQSFTEILSDLKFTFMGALQARHGRFVTINDLIFLSMESKQDGDIGPGLVEAEVDMRVITTTHLGGYRLVDKGPLFLDVMGGARITSLKADLELSGPVQAVERASSKTQVGPVIASRFRTSFGENSGFELYGDVGGFGVSSDLSWQLLGTVQYQISDHWLLGGGWRHFHAKQSKNDFEIDLSMSGPFLAFGYRF